MIVQKSKKNIQKFSFLQTDFNQELATHEDWPKYNRALECIVMDWLYIIKTDIWISPLVSAFSGWAWAEHSDFPPNLKQAQKAQKGLGNAKAETSPL